MRIFFFFSFLFLQSCTYPDIDTVPDFKDLELSEEELIDLCQLSSTDKNEIENCIKGKKIINEKN